MPLASIIIRNMSEYICGPFFRLTLGTNEVEYHSLGWGSPEIILSAISLLSFL